MILINIIIACVGTTLLMTSLNTVLASIINDLQITASTAQWLTSGYSLAMGIIMPLTAFLIRRFPTKRLYLTGLGLAAAGLVIDLVAPNFPILLFGRIMQACGNGILMSMSQVIILSIYPNEKKGMAMGWYGLAVGAAPVFAPTLGGILADLISWRAIFGVTLAIVLVSLVMSIVVMDNVLETVREKFDFLSFIISVFAFGGLTLGIGNLANYGIANPSVWIALVVGAIAAVLFVRRELSQKEPFLNLKVFRFQEYSVSVILEMLCYLIMMGISILMPLYVQTVMGYSATISGLVILPGALCNAIVSPFAGRLYDRTGMRRLSIVGAILIFVSTAAMCFVDTDTPLVFSSICYVVRSIAFGGILMPYITWGTSHVEKSAVADATALMSSLRTIAGSIGSAVFVGIMTMVAAQSAAAYGEKAGMHGINVAFICMTLLSVVVILISIIWVKESKEKRIKS